jgi:beta-glucanase (GH16 family)
MKIMSFRSVLVALVSFISIAFISSCAKQVDEVAGCEFPDDESLKLIWSDEFEGDVIKPEIWSFDTADGCQLGPNLCGWGNNELQYYTSRLENARVEDGKLLIIARDEDFGGREYTSARMVTKYKRDWRYGRVDVRAKVPGGEGGKGIWSAIWMLPTDNVYGIWPASGEIDIMEYIGNDSTRMFGTIHYGHDFHRFDTQDFPVDTIDWAENFHVYSVLWTEDCIQFQIDGIDMGIPNTRSTVQPTTWPFDQDFHLILNIAVGGNLPGDPDGTTTFPQTMEVDYVRVYQEISN